MHEDDFKNDDATAGNAGCFAAIEAILCREHEARTRVSVDWSKVHGWSRPTLLSSMPIAARPARYLTQRRGFVHRRALGWLCAPIQDVHRLAIHGVRIAVRLLAEPCCRGYGRGESRVECRASSRHPGYGSIGRSKQGRWRGGRRWICVSCGLGSNTVLEWKER